MHLRCIYNSVATNLLRVCIVDEAHIHPFDAHYQLALIATYALIQMNFRHPEHNHNNILAAAYRLTLSFNGAKELIWCLLGI